MLTDFKILLGLYWLNYPSQ